MRKSLLLTSALLLGAAAPAFAADNGFYLGASVGRSNVDIDNIGGLSAADFSGDDTGFKLIAGIRPLDFIAVEASYMDLGEESRNLPGLSTNVEASALSAYVLGFLPIPLPLVDVYGKIGLARWEVDGSLSSLANNFRVDDNGTEFAYGAGIQVGFGSLAARLEYESFDIDNTDGLDLYTLGVTWTFL